MINPIVLDRGLLALTSPSALLLLPSEIGDYVAANAAALAMKVNPIVQGPMNATAGRKVLVLDFVDGLIIKDGTATHFALTDDARQLVLVCEPLAVPKQLALGTLNTFAITAIDIIFPGLEP